MGIIIILFHYIYVMLRAEW